METVTLESPDFKHILSILSHLAQISFSCSKADLQPHHTIHTHRFSLCTCRRANEQKKLKNKRGEEDVGNQTAVASACTQSREDGCSQNGLVS